MTIRPKPDPSGLRKGIEKLQHLIRDFSQDFSEITAIDGKPIPQDIEKALRITTRAGSGYELWHPDPSFPTQVFKNKFKELGIPGRIMPRGEVYATYAYDQSYALYRTINFLLDDSDSHNLEQCQPKLRSVGWVIRLNGGLCELC